VSGALGLLAPCPCKHEAHQGRPCGHSGPGLGKPWSVCSKCSAAGHGILFFGLLGNPRETAPVGEFVLAQIAPRAGSSSIPEPFVVAQRLPNAAMPGYGWYATAGYASCHIPDDQVVSWAPIRTALPASDKWRVHIVGPDDIHECESFEAALVAQSEVAAEVLAFIRRPGFDPAISPRAWANILAPGENP